MQNIFFFFDEIIDYDFTPKIDNRNQNLAHANKRTYSLYLSLCVDEYICYEQYASSFRMESGLTCM